MSTFIECIFDERILSTAHVQSLWARKMMESQFFVKWAPDIFKDIVFW